jgi:predicted peroxiredoxin
MAQAKQLVVVITSGMDDEKSSVAWSIANGGVASGLEVTVFLAGPGVDWARKGAADGAHLNPFDPPMGDMVRGILENGSGVVVCPPCAKARGYTEDDLLDGTVLRGSVAIHEKIREGAATLAF